MASIYKEFVVNAPPEEVWDAIKDVGSVHQRLARNFVTHTELSGNVRSVTFANGLVAREEIMAESDAHRRLAYRSIEGRASHHNASLQVYSTPEGTSRVVWDHGCAAR